MRRLVGHGALALVLLNVVAPLSAEVRIRSSVEVKTERPRDAGMLAQLAMMVVPFQVAPGKADVVTMAARGAVRVEGLGPVLGIAPDIILIAAADGTVVGLVPSRGEYFDMPSTTPQKLSVVIESKATEKRHGLSDVLLGQQTERVSVSVMIEPKVPGTPGDMAYDPRTGRMVEAWTLQETPEERTRRFAASERSRMESSKQEPVTIESWESDAFGPVALHAAASRVSMTWFATAGYASTAEQGFPLRQVIRNPTYGYRVESLVQVVESLSLEDDFFRVPAHYRKVATPQLRPLFSR